MSSYAVADPQIEEVLDLETGEYLQAASLIGSDYGELMQLRMSLRTDIAAGVVRLRLVRRPGLPCAAGTKGALLLSASARGRPLSRAHTRGAL